jgi:phosphoribosylformimino-5-aminoimidazole carboxamide ribotide isomerase
MEDETVFGDDPVEVAQRWVDAGARRLHMVDLNGAFAGKPVNADVIKEVAEAFPDLPIQVGGGIRDEDTVAAYLEAGVQYTIIGTRAVSTPHFINDLCLEFPGHILVGLDAREGRIAIDGWSKLSHHSAIDMARRFEQDGVEAIVFTDIGRDGMMTGVNVDSTVSLAQSITIPVIASGGITNMEDIRTLCAVSDEGIMGAITGRALYEGALDLAAAQKLADELCAKQA